MQVARFEEAFFEEVSALTDAGMRDRLNNDSDHSRSWRMSTDANHPPYEPSTTPPRTVVGLAASPPPAAPRQRPGGGFDLFWQLGLEACSAATPRRDCSKGNWLRSDFLNGGCNDFERFRS